MASDQGPLPPAAERQENFEEAVACALHLWPALTLAVDGKWSQEDPNDVRDWFVGAIAGLYPDFTDSNEDPATQRANAAARVAQEPDVADVESVLLQVMFDEFKVNVDDDSAQEIAAQVVSARTQCAVGIYDEVRRLQTRFSNRKGLKVQFQQAPDVDQETDGDSDDYEDIDDDDEGGADVEMGEAPAVVVTKEKPPPEVDEDGFTKVTKKR